MVDDVALHRVTVDDGTVDGVVTADDVAVHFLHYRRADREFEPGLVRSIRRNDKLRGVISR